MLRAAVIIPIVRHPEATLVVVRRAEHLRRNPGQIAFPGGIVDPGDADARAAALREFEEEIGIARTRVRVVGRLDDVVTLAGGVTVAPFVGLVDPPFECAHDANETQSVHEIPLAALYADGAVHRGVERVERDGGGHDVETWLFDYDDLHVWGASARMLRALVERYRAPADLLNARPLV